MKKYIIILIIGLTLFGLGGYQNTIYEEKALVVSAVITDIKITEESSDSASAYKHTFYGEYTVDGKKYKNIKLETRYSNSSWPEIFRGDTIDIRVYPENPSKKVAEGGIFITVGVLITIYAGFKIHKIRKARKNAALQTEQA